MRYCAIHTSKEYIAVFKGTQIGKTEKLSTKIHSGICANIACLDKLRWGYGTKLVN